MQSVGLHEAHRFEVQSKPWFEYPFDKMVMQARTSKQSRIAAFSGDKPLSDKDYNVGSFLNDTISIFEKSC